MNAQKELFKKHTHPMVIPQKQCHLAEKVEPSNGSVSDLV